ncbi:glycerol-3-phosphate responsive antiterminator [Ornithinibacillus bavariensis]|uniref:Glycerol uptake operon antiterminator regulatory protein n=1 Tax=Ornithinibacillus bavariensis TaxID=545502 RepID=A0A920C8U1_9BACI|nr:glycerol-3-phosphate responsive antiterminator [Ornithinibacillus bavariensis]GIO27942.1 glycerol uptake operon antiterminator regulatory protein [Ornithinibacillus bavariensis]HAM81108.1 glycerol-3-phosphate responsive antiterminator GlpP [Ornithinibacillus sp.]
MLKLEGVLPAVRSMKEFEKVLKSPHENIIYLETRLSQLKNIANYTRKMGKKIIMHVDLIQGIKVDEYGLEYIINDVKVDGIISTRTNVISIAKKYKITVIQRLFALDSHALEHNLRLINNIQPDYIEVLPGVVPGILKEINDETGIPLIAGGLIRTEEDIQNALNGGAIAVTTSNEKLW